MISIILAVGGLCVLVTALIKELSENARGLICWTVSVLALTISAIIYFASIGSFSVDMDAFVTGLSALGAVTVIILLIELFAPTKRLRKRDKSEYDSRAAEQSLNLVFVIITAALTIAAAVSEALNMAYLLGFCLVPAAAVSARQLSYFLYRARTDTARVQTDKQLRDEAVKRLKTGNRGL